VTVPGNPTVERQRLASELRRLREEAGFTIERVAEALQCSDSKISRIETGRVGATPRDVRDMLELYKVSNEQRDALTQLARGPRRTGWWRTYGDVPLVPTYVDYEVAAAAIDSYQRSVVPGLLQTERYARTVIRAARPDLTPKQVRRRLQLRMERQTILAQGRPPRLRAVLDEAVLRRHIGGVKTLREQLRRLTEVAARRDVTLHVLRFEAGEHAGIDGEFTIFGFPERTAPSIVYLEHPAGDLYLRREAETCRYRRAFDLMLEVALRPDDSLAFVADLAEKLH
jgi:transcriptional regulator with XRE-family HTH domain